MTAHDTRRDHQLVLPQLRYEAPLEAIAWLCRVFDFAVRVVPQFHEPTERAWPNLSYSITVLVPDVDGHHEHAHAHGAQILIAPSDQPWGLRDYEVLDLEGRQWNFSQHLRDIDPGDWGADAIG